MSSRTTETSAAASPVTRGHLVLGLAILAAIVLGAAGLLGYRYYTHNDRVSNVAGGTLTETPVGLHFENPAEHLAFTAPSTWARFNTPAAQVMVRGEGCSFGLLEQRTVLSVNALADAEAKDLHQRHPEANPIIAPRSVAGHNGVAFSGSYTDAHGEQLSQTYILVDRGPNVITLIESATEPACVQRFTALENTLEL